MEPANSFSTSSMEFEMAEQPSCSQTGLLTEQPTTSSNNNLAEQPCNSFEFQDNDDDAGILLSQGTISNHSDFTNNNPSAKSLVAV